jgi:hypothetical protein
VGLRRGGTGPVEMANNHMTRAFFALAFFLASGREVAFVDLTGPAKTPDLRTSAKTTVRGGGVLTEHSRTIPNTLPITVEIKGVYPYVDRVTGAPKEAIEVELTNTGKSDISIPIGDDPVPLLSPGEAAHDRRYLRFRVNAGVGVEGGIDFADSASNTAHPESIAKLAPGDTVVFRLPFNTQTADNKRKDRNGAPLAISVRVTQYRRIVEDGEDVEEQFGASIPADKPILWP